MDLNELAKFIKITGGKYIIVENNKPFLVLMDFEEFKKSLLSEENKLKEVNIENNNTLNQNKPGLDDLPIV